MVTDDIVAQEHGEILSVWHISDDPVLVVGEHDIVATQKCVVLETYLAEATRKFSEKFHAADSTFGLSEKKSAELLVENRKLRKQIEEIAVRLKTVEKRVLDLLEEEKVIVLREITREEAKDEIKELFKAGRVLYYSDIAEKLRIDLEMVVEICQELLSKGEIEVSDDAASSR
jgi:hypothetical protein